MDCAFVSDIDPDKMRSYIENWGEQGTITRDVADHSLICLASPISAGRRCPVCAPALAGKRKGLGPETWTFMRLIQSLRTERRFDDVAVELITYGEGIFDGRRTGRAAEEWRRAIEHERSLGLHSHDRLNIQHPKSRTGAHPSIFIELAHVPVSSVKTQSA